MLFDGGFTFWNFLTDVVTIFLFVVWFWLFISILRDLFRREDLSGLGKALWAIGMLLVPYVGVFVYLITQSRGMAGRNLEASEQAREALRRMAGFSVADELEKLERLQKAGTITGEEYARLRVKLVT